MSDKPRLTSEQVLDDYFFDLLVEPEEAEPEEVEPESAETGEPDVEQAEAEDVEAGDAQENEPEAESEPVNSDEHDSGSQSSLAGEVSEETTDTDTVAADVTSLPEADAFVDKPQEQETESHRQEEAVATPFDFGKLSESKEGHGDTHAELDIELNLSSPPGCIPSWVPQVQEKIEIVSAVPYAEHSPSELEGLQRLLSQVSKMKPEPEAEVAPEVEGDAESEAAAESPVKVAAEAVTQPEEETALTAPEVQPETELEQVVQEPVEVEHEPEHAEPEVLVVPQTQTGGDEPPDLWHEKQEIDSEFQALFFEVNGVTFAVRLTELGGIHQLGELNRLIGRPPWYLGLMTSREHQLDVVDTARWVMPEKLSSDEHQENYRYIVMLGESKWGLACDVLHGTETLTEQSVRWREKAGKRPWLAGMVKEKMCALIHVNELISMLSAGLDVKSVI